MSINWVIGYTGKSTGPVLQHCSMGGAEAKRWDTLREGEREGGEVENKELAGS